MDINSDHQSKKAAPSVPFCTGPARSRSYCQLNAHDLKGVQLQITAADT